MVYLLEKYLRSRKDVKAPMPPPTGTIPLSKPWAAVGSRVIPKIVTMFLKSKVPR